MGGDLTEPPRSDASALDDARWLRWHEAYDDPASRLSRRLRVVQDSIRSAVDATSDAVRLVSMCAGQGRDVIGALADHPRRGDIAALLIERDPRLAAFATASANDAGLRNVRALCADAALTDNYAGAVPAEIVLACGVFGNISNDDIHRTVDSLPAFCAPGGTVIWTRGGTAEHDITPDIRRWFQQAGFDEIAFMSSGDEDRFRVGMHRFTAPPPPLRTGIKLFTFIR